MRVCLSPSVIDDEDALGHLDDLLRILETGRHRWIIDDIDAIERSRWVQQGGRNGARILELLRKSATEGVYGVGESTVELEIGNEDGQTSPALAPDILGRPAYLVVENETSDGQFLRALIQAYGATTLAIALDEGWLELRQAGGTGEIPKLVEILIRERGADPRRVQALSDSDRRFPGEESDTVRKMARLREDAGIAVHVLHKRESENYLPHDAIVHHKHYGDKTYRAFLELSDEQKDYFDMKHGFKRGTDGSAELLPLQEPLFSTVRKPVLRELVGGFGKDCGQWFAGQDGEAALYISREAMNSRCATNPDELPAVLAQLEAML